MHREIQNVWRCHDRANRIKLGGLAVALCLTALLQIVGGASAAAPKTDPLSQLEPWAQRAVEAAKEHHGLPEGVPVPQWARDSHANFAPPAPQAAAAIARRRGGREGPLGKEPGETTTAKNQLGLRESEVPPVRYMGGVVQETPRVHVIFWGSNWTTTAAGNEARPMLLSMYEHLNGSSYAGILTQYFDGDGRVSTSTTVDSLVDTRVAAPTGVEDSAIRTEVDWAIKQKKPGWSASDLNAQYVVITAPGTTYAAGFGHFCAYHDRLATEATYSIVPYAGDAPFGTTSNCDSYYGGGSAARATSVMASHEWAESATDPLWDTAPGWQNLEGYELTDLCATPGDQLPNGDWVQGQYDDHLNQCALADEDPPHVLAITDSAVGVTRNTATMRGTVNPESLETKYRFEYGTTTAYGTSIPAVDASVGSGRANVSVSQALRGLKTDQTYHYRVVATNSDGTTYGEDRTFTTARWVKDPVSTPPGSAEDYLEDVSCLSGDWCMGVGFVYPATSTAMSREWTGNEWALRSIPLPSGGGGAKVFDVSCTSSSACTAVGRYVDAAENMVPMAVRWNGTSWTQQSIPTPASEYTDLQGVSCPSASECIAVGYSKTASGGWVNYSVRWSGGTWSALSTPNATGSVESELDAISCVSATFCVADGWYNDEAGSSRGVIVIWNGTSWSVSTPASTEVLSNVSCASSSFCIAVGRGTLQKWNGTSWSSMSKPAGTSSHYFLDVSCTSPTYCVVVGDAFNNRTFNAMTVAMVWDGTAWSVTPTPRETELATNELSGVSCTAVSTCKAVGGSMDSGRWKTIIERREPDQVATGSYVSAIGSSGSGSGQLKSPTGLAVDGQGNIWVADTENHRIQQFSSSGAFVRMVGSDVNKTTHANVCTAASGNVCGVGLAASGAGQFNHPLDVAIDSSGTLWVTDGENGRVQHLNSTGGYLGQFGTSGTGSGQFVEPWGIDVAPDGHLWVADARYARVSEFTAAGALVRIVGDTAHGGNNATSFSFPEGVAVDAKGRVWVADSSNDRVVKLSSTGQYLGQFGGQGTGAGQFEEPTAVAVKATGDLLVTDWINSRVEEFTPMSEYVDAFGTKGSAKEQFWFPRGIATGRTGLVYVSDTGNNRIQVWRQPTAPTATTQTATEVKSTEALLNGIVNPGGLATTYKFEYGRTTAYGSTVPVTPGSVGAGTEAVPVSAAVTSLLPNTIYHYRLVATNTNGTAYGGNGFLITAP